MYTVGSLLTFLENLQVFPENITDVRRSAEQKAVATLTQKVNSSTKKLRRVDAFEVEVVNSPLQPMSHVRRWPERGIWLVAKHTHTYTHAESVTHNDRQTYKHANRQERINSSLLCAIENWRRTRDHVSRSQLADQELLNSGFVSKFVLKKTRDFWIYKSSPNFGGISFHASPQ